MMSWCSGYHYQERHSTKPELRFYTSTKPPLGVSQVFDGGTFQQMTSKRLSLANHSAKIIHNHHIMVSFEAI